jgi:hypothetical protein
MLAAWPRLMLSHRRFERVGALDWMDSQQVQSIYRTLAAAHPRSTGSTTQAADPPSTTSCRGRRPQRTMVAKLPGER